jgi:nucleoid DNA-binding protein
MNTATYIADLLAKHDCVIVPGFGGFIGNRVPARIAAFNHTFFPPAKSLLFNINLTHNDGLLASQLVEREKISYTQALRRIGQFVEETEAALVSGQQVILEKIGTLSKDHEGNIQFEQDGETNYLDDSFGLATFVSLPVQREKFQRRVEKKVTRYLGITPVRRKRIPRAVKWAASLTIPIGVAAILGITHFDVLKNGALNYSGLFYSSETSAPAPTKVPDKVTMAMPANERVSPPAKNEVLLKPVQESVKESGGSFAIIIGAFRIRDNAERIVAKLCNEGHKAVIIDQTKTGLFRVSIDSYSNREEAIRELADIRAVDYPAAWLLEK